MMGTTAHGNTQKHRYYRHRPVAGEPTKCSVKPIRADELEEKLLNHLDDVLKSENYLDRFENQLKERLRSDSAHTEAELAVAWQDLETIEAEMENAFKLHARNSDDSLNEIFTQRLKRLQNRKKELEAKVAELQSQLERTTSPSLQSSIVQANFDHFRRNRGGANKIVLKRLFQSVVESLVAYPEKVALRYWTSNEKVAGDQSPKKQKAPDLKPGATFFETCDLRVLGSSIIKNGRAGGMARAS